MATSGNKKGSPIGFWQTDYIIFYWKRVSYSVADNTSTIEWSISEFNSNDTFTVGARNNETYYGEVNGNYFEGFANVAAISPKGNAKITSGTVVIPHNSDGSKSVAFRATVHLNNVGWMEVEGTFTLDVIPRPIQIVSASNFTDEENPTITYNSPSGNAPQSLNAYISLDGNTNVVSRSISKTETSYTFELTDDERARLRRGATTTDSTTVRFILDTKIDNQSYIRYTTKTLTIVNSTPTLSPTVKDINAETTALTGNDKVIVRYHSDVEFNTGATAMKEATIKTQTVKCGSQVVNDTTIGTMSDISNHIFTFDMEDSRGHTAHAELETAFIPYVNLTAVLKVDELTLDGNLIFSIRGNYFNGNFGLRNNALSIVYTLEKNGQVVNTITLNPTEQGTLDFGLDTYTYRYTITGLTLEEADRTINSYTLQAVVSDLLTPAITTERITSSGTPIFDWSKDDFVFNVPVLFGQGFTNNIGLKTTSFARTLTMNMAGSYVFCDLDDLGISSDNNIYSLTGAIAYNGRTYPLPSPALDAAGLNNLPDCTKLWIDGTEVKITIGAAWGTAAIRIVVLYF